MPVHEWLGPAMRGLATVLMIAAVFTAAPAMASDPCTDITPAAADYLKVNPDWTVIHPDDLTGADRLQWLRHHRGFCPGVAMVDLDGSSRPFTALGLIRRNADLSEEKVVLVRQTPTGLEVRVLVPAERITNPLVLYRLPRGTTKEWDSDKPVTIVHESLGVAWLEASSRQYYWDNGAFRCVPTSD